MVRVALANIYRWDETIDENASDALPALKEVVEAEEEEAHGWITTINCLPKCVDLSYHASESVRSLEMRVVDAHKRLWGSLANSDQKRCTFLPCTTLQEPRDQTFVFPKLQYTPRPPRTGSFVMREASKKWCHAGSVSTAATVDTALSASSLSQNGFRSLADVDADEEVEAILDGENFAPQPAVGTSTSINPCVWGYFVDTGSPAASRQSDSAPHRRKFSPYRRFLSKEINASERYCGVQTVSVYELRGQTIHRVTALPDLLLP